MSAFSISRGSLEETAVNLDSNMARWIEIAPAMMHSTDANGRILSVSDVWLNTLGYARDEVIGKPATDFVTSEPRLRAIGEAPPEHSLRGRCENIDSRMVHKTGRILDVLFSATLVRSAEEQGYASVAVVVDVTTMRDAERRRIESEARFRLLAENTSDAIVFWPIQADRISYVSPAIRALLGYEPDEFAGIESSYYVHHEDLAGLLACHASLSADNRRVTNAHRARHRDGGWIWVEIALTFVGAAADGELGIIGVLRDVSERQRQAEALQQARDAAETAGRIKADFLANMSHELRTPLAGILGIHDILQADGTLNERQGRLVKLAEQSGRMLLNLVNDILDYSKIEAGKLELKSVRFSTADLIGSSVAIISGLAAAKRLDVQVWSDEDIAPQLMGDEDRLRQILVNFLNNAVKFTRAGRVALKVERLGASDGAERLRFSVTDTGIGIAEDKIDRLYHRFSQLDSSPSRAQGGSGLGLAIVKRLVELMNGDLGVESVPGEGSTFWFVVMLPVAREEASPRAIGVPVEPRARLARVLVAEDIEVNQVIIRGMLESAGHRVEMVSNGGDAVIAASTNAFDVILMDIQMPGTDGVTATTRIRALAGPAARLPIIAMTADVLAPKVAQFMAAGMDDHVGKPFSREELLAVVARRLPATGASELSAARVHDPVSNSGDPRNATVDNATLDRLVTMIGQPALDILLGKLATQLGGRFANEPRTDQSAALMAREAHKLASSAGMLGFDELSRRCAHLEATLNAREDAIAPLAEARAACVLALAEISLRVGARPRAAAIGRG